MRKLSIKKIRIIKNKANITSVSKNRRKKGNYIYYKGRKIIFIITILTAFQLPAQNNFSIQGKVGDNNHLPVFATIQLIKNSKIVSYEITDDQGIFELKNIIQGDYKFVISSLGYKDFVKELKINHNIKFGEIILETDTKVLNTVVITSKKKAIKQTNNGIILNINNTALSKMKSSLDILELAPNVSFMNGLEILGSKRIKITLNGQSLNIKPDKIADFIGKLKPNTLKKIEIIDSGGANFESEQDAQINIYTTDNKGLIIELDSQVFYNKHLGTENDVSLYYQKNKYNYFVNIYHQYHQPHSKSFQKTDIGDSIFYNKISNSKLIRKSFYVSGGFNYKINNSSDLGFLYDYEYDIDKKHLINSNNGIISPNVTDSIIKTNHLFDNISNEHTASIQYKLKLDTLNSNLIINMEYNFSKLDISGQMQQDFYKDQSLLQSQRTSNNYDNTYRIVGIKTEWDKNFKNENELLSGIKFSATHIEDIMDFINKNNQSNSYLKKFIFRQNLLAAYTNYYFSLGKYNLSTGLRFEYTFNNFGTNSIDENNNHNFQILPNFKINRKFNKKHFLQLYVAKKISRPSYYIFNPNIDIYDIQNRYKGNPNLKPQEIYRLQINYNYNNKYSIIYKFDYQINNIANYTTYVPESGYILTSPVNTGYRYYHLLYLSIPVTITKSWKTYNKLYLAITDFNSDLFPNTYFNSCYLGGGNSNTINLSKKTDLYFNISYTGRNKYLNTTYEPRLSSNIYLSTKISKNAKLFIGLNDIFNTQENKYYKENNGIKINTYYKSNTRSVYINFRYTFEKGKEIDDNDINKILEPEKNRTGR